MIEEFNHVMDYVEDHLLNEISYTDITRLTGVSDYHFRKLFAFMAGITLNDYIKQRRFTFANADLIAGKSVTEVAFKYGYQSLEGFSRAFKDWSSYLPSEIIENQIQKTYSRFYFTIDIKGGHSMEVKIENKPAFNLIGVTKRVPVQYEGENQAIVALANSITEQQREELQTFKELYPQQVVNASYQFDDSRFAEKGQLTHLIGCLADRENPFQDLQQIAVPTHTWAIFPNCGPFPNTLQNTWQAIYSEWLPSSNYELVDLPEISFSRYDDPINNRYSEIWLAIKEKK